jgi:cytochrome c oxidase assembly protein subunit 15
VVPAVRWTATVAAILTFAVIVLGALVRATNSGVSCPDWPTCYGHWVPLPHEIPPEAGYSFFQVMLEWLHRLLAGVILGPLVLLIAALTFLRRRQDPRLAGMGGLLVLLLLSQAMLGAVTVLDQNSPWSVALHLGNALIVLAVLILIVERTRRRPVPAIPPALPVATGLAWLVVLATMLSAAMTAKSGASLACSTWPLCNGAVIPDLSDPLIAVHFTHRVLAAASVLLLVKVFRLAHPVGGAVRTLALGALALILLQVALGALVILHEVALPVALLHQAAGVLTFAVVTLLFWRSLGVAAAMPATRRADGKGARDGLGLRGA